MRLNLQIDYLEFYSAEFEASEQFFSQAFGWEFIPYGQDYRDIQQAGIGGGLERSPARSPTPAPLVVLKTDDLDAALAQVKAAGAVITKEIFDFPGGRRFHFLEPGGTEMAVWIKTSADG